ncbi:type VI secretion system ATPase TssH [Chitinimonas sp. BJB300]|uniref:type VI secretion system ATPase TssH n=1 Tax=Chitinimonas sp. BJB300 TaxID=1559339 RepID=UPI000C0F7720|nr:type VI secretion system ATPase TssH [Chitinimonas sp. BJB300]PHV13176.1 type VI secretion system ATPase TssH [Chitinimonas sp. BJB300]TSJ87158.1 type VI secretion system ATPase TssH [Chitinimonas sp. BJB300]
MASNLKALISKLTPTARLAAERSANLCMTRGHYEVDLEHLFLALLEQPGSDLLQLCQRFDISPTQLERDLNRELENFKTGNSRTPVFSPHLPTLLEHAWLLASIETGTSLIRSGHILLALLTAPDLAQIARRGSPLFARFPLDTLKHKLAELTTKSAEAGEAIQNAPQADDAAPGDTATSSIAKTPALDQFTSNLTARAQEGKIDPVIGRETEIRQAIDILTRRRQNNPILTGEAGVGKTAVVEGLAQKIAAGDVPPPLQNVALHVLDLGLLQAGASVKGEFENRLKNVIDEVKKSPHPIILFIDEAHTMIGAGGQAGQNDAANLLKPALARGELRTIAATTWAEYKKYFEKDAALARRFQVVKVDEPNLEVAASMLRAMVGLMEKHFIIRVLDEAIVDAVHLSARYITGRQLPDKAVSVLDTACARVALAQSAKPESIELAEKRLERTDVEIAALQREVASGGSHTEKLKDLRESRAALARDIENQNNRWQQELGLARQIGELRHTLEQKHAADPNAELKTERAELDRLKTELKTLQGESGLVPTCVDSSVIADIISAWTGIPVGSMVKNEIKAILGLADTLKQRVIGQDHAMAAVAQRVRTARANLEDPNKPKGVFLFVGPSGVGKTETALALADSLYGGERNLITINMSEYQEAHTVSSLKGSPPGYVGYGEGGVLTEAVRRKPYSVVLLDEVEKAHPDVMEMFFQVFDKGVMEDGEGREIDFKNTLIILTSNVGSSTIMQACLNKARSDLPDADSLAEMIRPQLFKEFKPALLGRMKVVPFYPISDDVLEAIIRLKLNRVASRVAANHKAAFVYDDSLVDAVFQRCTEVDSGARNVDHILNGTILPEIAGSVLERMAEGEAIQKIKVGATKAGKLTYKVS